MNPTTRTLTLTTLAAAAVPATTASAFVIYRKGNALQITTSVHNDDGDGDRENGNDDDNNDDSDSGGYTNRLETPVIRICALSEQHLLMVNCRKQLLLGSCSENAQRMHVKLLRHNVSDVDYCRNSHIVYIVTGSGTVFAQTFKDGLRLNNWQSITFDPLELSEDGIKIARVKCSSKGALFLTTTSEIYALGSCGDIFDIDAEPQQLRLFERPKEILDVAAGDEHFVMLLRGTNDDDDLQSMESFEFSKQTAEVKGLNVKRSERSSPQRIISFATSTTLETPSIARKQHTRNSSSTSGNSLISQTSNSQQSEGSQSDHSEFTLQNLLRYGRELLQTQVCTFGSSNDGLLGTGDHIKRLNVSTVEKLTGIGVCAITAGREHSIARTLDGRVFHWGLNSKQQLDTNRECSDISGPQELKFDATGMSDTERSILASCCGDYQTLLLNAEETLYARNVQQVQHEVLSWQGNLENIWKSATIYPPFILAAGSFILRNVEKRRLQKIFFEPFNSLRQQLQNLLYHRDLVESLLTFHQRNNCPTMRQLVSVSQSFLKLLNYAALTLHSVERYYHGDVAHANELIFVSSMAPSLALFEQYCRAYCDIRSINGFAEAAKIYTNFSNISLNKLNSRELIDFERVFQYPFKMPPIFVQCLELLSRTQRKFFEQLQLWQSFAQQQRIDLELANNTHEFWLRNERNTKLRQFCRPTRRVILSSETVPLRLGNSALGAMVPGGHPTFILFSDCLCQLSTNLQTFPLVALWLKHENEKTLRVTTPEKSFLLVARSQHDKMLWYDQLETAIAMALGRSGLKLSRRRRMAYVYSLRHSKYAGVHAYGQWRSGVLHGNCYLQFPDEKFYLGEARHGEIEGYGKMIIPSLGVYEGYFKNGKFHGNGCFEMKDNEVYSGHFRDGLFNGHGILRTTTYSYVGEFQANSRSGYGIQDDAITGEKYMGMFADNRRAGTGICITMSGDYFEGIFSNNELVGQGIAVFENGYYYEGELTLNGPNGKGIYYMPQGSIECDNSSLEGCDNAKHQMTGNILSGQLGGTWNDVRIVSGTVALNRPFPKYPKSIGDLIVGNSRKWRALFDNFEEEILGENYSSLNTKDLWNRIAIYITNLRDREKMHEQQDSAYQSYVHSYFARNIAMGFSASMDKISLKSANSLVTCAKSSIFDTTNDDERTRLTRRSYSQETLFECDLNDLEFMNSTTFLSNEEHSFQNVLNTQLGNWASDSVSSLNSSYDSAASNNNISKNYGQQKSLDFVPNFGMSSLDATDVSAIKEYLVQAFKDAHHPLYLLNQRIANAFYNSYGCWKVKPTPILAKQAMREWESISKRVYHFVRKLFPSLPEDYCVIESTREVVSHITLLYPIVLSEGIYSTLFVLYANKYSTKDEVYRQNLLFAEKLEDTELSDCLGLDSVLLPVVSNEYFHSAVQTLKQMQEKYSPKAMLIVIEKCMQLITEAYKITGCENSPVLTADNMMPLTLFLVLRASVPHLGAELALLDDLTGGSNFQIEMNGFAGYCYTTLKACYEHLTTTTLRKT